MRYAVLGLLILFSLGDGCSPPPNVVGVQDYGRVTGRVLDAMTNRPIANALVSVGSVYTARADATGAFDLRSVAGDQTVTARAPGFGTATADTTIPKDATVSIGYIRLVALTAPVGQPTLQPPPIPTPAPTPTPSAAAKPSASPAPAASAAPPSAAPASAAPASATPSASGSTEPL
jgi:Carboxypeptidase regulatory-like domain